MRLNLCIGLFFLSFIGCKKESNDLPPSRTSFEQALIYKVFMTTPSPADSARGLFRDSLIVKKIISRSDADFFSNIPHMSANIIPGFPGFSVGYDDDNNSFPYFAFTTNAFPNVPREFELNKTYENITIPGGLFDAPIFLGTHTGNDGMNYFVNNVYPLDGGYPKSKTYTSVVFTDKSKFLVGPVDTVLLATGKISGYIEKNWGTVDPNKYKQRWDFTVNFTDLKIDK